MGNKRVVIEAPEDTTVHALSCVLRDLGPEARVVSVDDAGRPACDLRPGDYVNTCGITYSTAKRVIVAFLRAGAWPDIGELAARASGNGDRYLGWDVRDGETHSNHYLESIGTGDLIFTRERSLEEVLQYA